MGVQSKINKLIGGANKIIASCCGKNFILNQIITDIPPTETIPPPANICWVIQFQIANDEGAKLINSFSFDFASTSGATQNGGSIDLVVNSAADIKTSIEGMGWDDSANNAFMVWDNLDVQKVAAGESFIITITFTNPINNQLHMLDY